MSARRLKQFVVMVASLMIVGLVVVSFTVTDPAKVSSLIAIAALALSVYLNVRNQPSESAELSQRSLDDRLDELAEATRKHWRNELKVRRLNSPDRMPVSWDVAPDDLFLAWPELFRAATVWKGGKHCGRWARSADELPRSGNLAAVLECVPTGRLVVLGEPGSGKSILLIGLTLSLLDSRGQNDPLPLLISAASWDAGREQFDDWLHRKLGTDYPTLREPASGAGGGVDLVDKLRSEHRLLLIIDGLDEIPAESRGTAIEKINQALEYGEGLVLSCRTDAYRRSEAGAAPRRALAAAAGIVLRDLDPDVVQAYLAADAGPGGARRWAPVFDRLGGDTPVGRSLRTPLMVGMARIVYHPPSGDQSHHVPSPNELCDERRFPTAQAVDGYLFDAFLEAAYRGHLNPDSRRRWPHEKARRWLEFLAVHLDGRVDLAWWELPRAVPKLLAPVLVGLVGATATATVAQFGKAVHAGIGMGVGVGLLVGFVVGLSMLKVKALNASLAAVGRFFTELLGRPLGRVRDFSPAVTVVAAIAAAIIGGIVGAMVADVGVLACLPASLAVGLGVGTTFGSAGAIAGGFAGAMAGAFVTRSHEIEYNDAAIVNSIGVGLICAAVVLVGGRTRPARGIRPTAMGPVLLLSVAFACAILLVIEDRLRLAAIVAGLCIAIFAAVGIGLVAGDADLTASSVRGLLVPDRRTFVTFAITVGIAIGGITGVVFALWWLDEHTRTTAITAVEVREAVRIALIVGGGVTVVTGPTVAFVRAVWGSYLVARLWLALSGNLPVRLLSFLHDAHEQRGVLRQIGATYQFLHVDLQRHLAGAARQRGEQDASRRPMVRPRRMLPAESDATS